MDSLRSTHTPGPAQINAALFLLRIASALVVLYHGGAILFGAFGGPGPQGFSAFLHTPVIVGYLVGLAQFGGGLAMLTGALIRVGAACILAERFLPRRGAPAAPSFGISTNLKMAEVRSK